MEEKQLKELVENLSKLSVADISQLANELKEVWNVNTDVQVAAAAPAGAAESEKEEQTSFNVSLTNFGDKKIMVIKEVRALTNLGLSEAKELVESCTQGPKEIKAGVTKEEAEQIKQKLEAAGAKVTVS